ncbi:MAG: hypothetical protein ACK58L_21360 [Planctomycetota bacterium]
MTKGNMKIAGYVCLALTAVLLFVAWERYSTNAKAVEAVNRMMNNSPMGGVMGGMMQQMTGQSKLEPSVPAATTYSILLAVISGVAGAALLAASQEKQKTKRKQPKITFGTNKPMNPSGGSDVS